MSLKILGQPSILVGDPYGSISLAPLSGVAELEKVPLCYQIQLADKIASGPKIKEIAKWAGRLKQIARQKQKSKHDEASERNDVTFSNDINRLLPVELSLYNHLYV